MTTADAWRMAATYLADQGKIHRHHGSEEWAACLTGYASVLRDKANFEEQVLSKPTDKMLTAVEAWLNNGE